MEDEKKINLDVFGEKTTYLNDFKPVKIPKRKYYFWPKDRIEKSKKPPPKLELKDNETLEKLTEVPYIPFNLFWTAKPIVGTNPHVPPIIPKEEIDTDLEKVIKSRPRLYMSPAVSLDDTPDPDMRKLVCQYLYSTEWRNVAKYAALKPTERPPIEFVVEKNSNPVRVKFTVELNPPLSPEWLAKSKNWDIKQKRAFVDPTKTFWLKNELSLNYEPGVDPLKGVVQEETKKEIHELILEDNLRLGHDYPKPGYDGHKVQLPLGIPLRKTHQPVTHRFVTSYQAMSNNVAK